MPARWTPTWRHRAVDAPRRRRLKPWARTALRVLAGAAALGILWLLVLRPLSVRLATAGTPGARVELPDWVEEDLLPIIGEENMVQELPAAFRRVLEAQKAWRKNAQKIR